MVQSQPSQRDLDQTWKPTFYLERFKPLDKGECILVTGPNLLTYSLHSNLQSSSYLLYLLQEMMTWCLDRKIISQAEKGNDGQSLSEEQTLLRLAYKIEEYLPNKVEQQQCLRDVVLHTHALTSEAYQFLTQYTFRGYISTTYDTLIENVYQTKYCYQLVTIYNISSQAIVNYHSKQPFMLKLYGDINNKDSLHLHSRITEKPAQLKNLEHLCHSLSTLPVMFVGFERDDIYVDELQNAIGGNNFLFYDLHTAEFYSNHLLSAAELALKRRNSGEYNHSVSRTNQNRASNLPTLVEKDQTYASQQPRTIEIFLSFVSNDRNILFNLNTHLNVLKRQQLRLQNLNIIITHRDNIGAGHNWKSEIERFLASAHIILLLVSIHFLDSEFCTEVEMTQALARHNANQARVIPIILDSCPWHNEVFSELVPLPESGRPVNRWGRAEEAYANITAGIERSIKELLTIE